MHGARTEEAMSQLQISSSTYWRYRNKIEEELSAQFLQNQWRLISQWWIRKQNVYRALMAGYARSLQEMERNHLTKPNYWLLVEASKLEDDCFDRLHKIGFLPNSAVSIKTGEYEDLKQAFKEALSYENNRNGKNGNGQPSAGDNQVA